MRMVIERASDVKKRVIFCSAARPAQRCNQSVHIPRFLRPWHSQPNASYVSLYKNLHAHHLVQLPAAAASSAIRSMPNPHVLNAAAVKHAHVTPVSRPNGALAAPAAASSRLMQPLPTTRELPRYKATAVSSNAVQPPAAEEVLGISCARLGSHFKMAQSRIQAISYCSLQVTCTIDMILSAALPKGIIEVYGSSLTRSLAVLIDPPHLLCFR